MNHLDLRGLYEQKSFLSILQIIPLIWRAVATCIFFSSQEIFIYLQTAGHWPDFSKPEESAAVTWSSAKVRGDDQWFGLLVWGPVVWDSKALRVPLSNHPFHRGIPYVSKPTNAPKQQAKPLAEMMPYFVAHDNWELVSKKALVCLGCNYRG